MWYHVGMSASLVISKAFEEALSSPRALTKPSSLSCRRPTTMTFLPLSTSLDARASPMPDVAPMTRIFLYGKPEADIALCRCIYGLMSKGSAITSYYNYKAVCTYSVASLKHDVWCMDGVEKRLFNGSLGWWIKLRRTFAVLLDRVGVQASVEVCSIARTPPLFARFLEHFLLRLLRKDA